MTTMNMTARFKHGAAQIKATRPLTNDEIRQVCPAVLAEQPYPGVSARYTFIPFVQVMDNLRKEGFQPFAVVQSQPKMQEKFDTARFCVRFRHESTIADKDGAPELIAQGSAGGQYGVATLLGGYLRSACFNSLITGDLIEEYKVRHQGDIVEDYINGAYSILSNFDSITESRDEMRSTILTPAERLIFASSALTLKYDDPEAAPITAEQLLLPRRSEDREPTLWNAFNVAQEHLIKGGLHGRTQKGKRTTTRPIQAIQANVGINKALWQLAEAMKRLKDGDYAALAA